MLNIFGIKFTWKMVLLGISLSPIFMFIQKYIYNDWEFLKWLFLLIALDTFTGVWKSYKAMEISSKGFSQVITKVTIYSIFLIVIHILQYFTVDKQINSLFGWLNDVAYSTLIIRESISIFENLAVIEPKLFPIKILEKLKAFENDKMG